MMAEEAEEEEAAEEAGWSKKNKNRTWQCGEKSETLETQCVSINFQMQMDVGMKNK